MRVEVNAGWHDELDAELFPRMDRLVDGIAKDASRYAPRDTGAMAKQIVSYRAGPKLWRVHSLATYTCFVEFGTGPHPIKAHGDYPLRNRRSGKVFGPLVHHPGTPEQPFMRPALYQARSL